MQRLTYVFPTTTDRDRASRAGQHVRDFMCAVVSFPNQWPVVIGLGMRLNVCMCTRLENGVLHNGQQPGSAVNSFFDHSEFEAMNSLSGWEAAHCDEHQFHAKIKVSIWAVFKLSLFDKWSEQRKEERNKKWHFCYRTLLRWAVFRMTFGQLHQSCWSRRHSKRKPGRLNKLLACLWWSYMAFA